MNWLIIPILLFIMFIIYLTVQQPKNIAVATPVIPQPETPTQEEPEYEIRDGKDIPKPIDTTMMDCNIDKRLTKKFEDTYFSPAKKDIDLDFPPHNIECCPFSKPMSTDLPVGNIPMCYAVKNKTYLRTKV